MKKDLSAMEINNILDNTVASLAMESMHCTDEEKEIGKKILSGELDGNKVIAERIAALENQRKS